jgi:hypothetical protein
MRACRAHENQFGILAQRTLERRHIARDDRVHRLLETRDRRGRLFHLVRKRGELFPVLEAVIARDDRSRVAVLIRISFLSAWRPLESG